MYCCNFYLLLSHYFNPTVPIYKVSVTKRQSGASFGIFVFKLPYICNSINQRYFSGLNIWRERVTSLKKELVSQIQHHKNKIHHCAKILFKSITFFFVPKLQTVFLNKIFLTSTALHCYHFIIQKICIIFTNFVSLPLSQCYFSILTFFKLQPNICSI